MNKSLTSIRLIFLLILIPFLSSGQDNNVVSAYAEMQEGKLLEAKEYIDKAILHEQTKDQAKTWYYRGMIYQNMAIAKGDSEYTSIPNTALIAAQSFQKARTFDVSRIDSEDLEKRCLLSAKTLYEEAVNLYLQNDYQQSIESFSLSLEIKEEFGITDSSATFNIAVMYQKMDELDQAKQAFQKCININYHSVLAYQSIISIHQEQGDYPSALNVANEAINKFPDNYKLMITKINILGIIGNNNEALDLINSVITEQTENPKLYFIRGIIYTELEQVEKSEADYLKALELNPQYLDAQFNLGALYFNLAASKYNAASDVQATQKYEKLKKETDDLFTKAMTFLEAAHELAPSESSIMQSLLQIYEILNLTDKYTEMKAKLNKN